MKKLLCLAAALLLFTSVISGCSHSEKSTAKSTSSSHKDGQITLKFIHRWPKEPERSYFASVVKEFEKENPNIHVQTEAVLNDAYKEKIRVLAGTNHPPDIFYSWSGEFADKFVRGGKALDLTPYYEKDKAWSSRLAQSQISPFTFNGKIYGVPLFMDGKTFFYNKNIFHKLHLDPPKSYNQLIEDSKVIKSKGYIPIAFGDKAPWAIAHYIGTLNQRMVPQSVLKKDYNRKTGTFTNPEYVKALEKLKELNPYFNKDVNAMDHEFARQMFNDGKAAMMFLETNEISLVEPDIHFKLGFFDLPGIEGGQGRADIMSGAPEGFMISSKTQHPEAAMKFLEFLTNKKNGQKLVKDAGYLSPVDGALTKDNSTKAMRDAATQVKNSKDMAEWLDSALDIRIVNAYLEGAQMMLNGDMTPEEVMKGVQKAAKSVRELANVK
ncbi:ABC transporter substrate-binding protein [Scopulibacillus cellulosilyticus]|uniref:ABC transporter substrate-binding protein n=1 Tax=Scopulibacillus cellulosilyticus TaxID=2665665 RepID=A0ABW2PZ33_9BACL